MSRRSPFYRFTQLAARLLWRARGSLDVQGLDHVPSSGPFLLIANHQSYLDPILILAVIPREVHAMAKSTQFAHPVIGFLLKRLRSFPVRRFQIDPQAVRLVLRRLGEGQGVAIYVEGERSWDGRLQAPRLGALRTILRAGVPVLPCGIDGAYEAWPRWSRLGRGHVTIRFGPPLRFPQVLDRSERERRLPEVRDRLMSELDRLSEPPGAGTAGWRP